MRRRIVPVTASLALLAATLTACTSATPAELCEPTFGPGALSASVRVEGDSADTLKVGVASNAQVLGAQRSIVHASTQQGRVIEPGSIVEANLAFVGSSNGQLLSVSSSFGTDTGDSLFVASSGPSSILGGTLCATAGDTVAIALTAQESAQFTGQADETIVAIAQIVDVLPARAEGAIRALPFGFPAVTTDDTGRPGMVLPPQNAPSETRSALRIEGSGDLVQAEDEVVGQVLVVGWDGRERRNTWADQGPLNLGSESSPATDATFRAQLTGAPIGSQIVVIEPGENGATVSVVDILAVL